MYDVVRRTVMELKLTKKNVIAGVVALWAIVLTLSLSANTMFGVLYLLGVPLFFILPGILTLGIFNLRQLKGWGTVLVSVGVSVLELMFIALAANWFLPFVGISRPLDALPLWFLFSVVLFTLLYFSLKDIEELVVHVPRFLIAETKLGLAFMLPPLFFVVTSIDGAVRLNNGIEDNTTLLMLAAMALYSFLVVIFVNRIEKQVIPAILYLNALALLFMTSLRGWFVSGHDIQREFFVFQLAKGAGLWDVSTYVDAYNACLSITVLPTLLVNTLHIADPYVYKVLLQVLFALVLVLVYLTARTWLNHRLAFLTGLCFMAFPTFFQDMPFLIRQEVAFLFFGLMVYVLFERHLSLFARRTLFFLFGVGVVLSHYSTTYTVLFVLMITYLVVTVLRLFGSFIPSYFKNLSTSTYRKRAITLPIIFMLVMVSFAWTNVITGTGGHAEEVAGDVMGAVLGGFTGSSYSQDVFVFFSFDHGTTDYTMEDFIAGEVQDERAENPDLYFPQETYEGYEYMLVPDDVLPVTTFGSFLGVGEVVLASGKILSKLLQLAILLGLIYALYNRSWIRRFDDEMYALAAASMVFIVSCMVVPLLSKEYGVFRAIQQSLFVLVPFMVLGLIMLARGVAHLTERWVTFFGLPRRDVSDQTVLRYTGALAVLFFLFSTGVFAQLVGGSIPPVHLNNSGDDYDHYVVTDAEEEAILWLQQQIFEDMATTTKEPLVQADRFGKKKLQAVLTTPVSGNIFPGSIQKDAYVFVSGGVLQEGVARQAYDGVVLKYTYPVAFLDANKSLVFNNGEVRIYK